MKKIVKSNKKNKTLSLPDVESNLNNKTYNINDYITSDKIKNYEYVFYFCAGKSALYNIKNKENEMMFTIRLTEFGEFQIWNQEGVKLVNTIITNCSPALSEKNLKMIFSYFLKNY